MIKIIKYPKKIDLKKFEKNITNPEIKFGLPKDIKFCKKCVISNQRPNSTIEFKNTEKEKRKLLTLMKMVSVTLVIIILKKI